ncbi:MAG: spore coat protein U domain-containing protein [Proteobacteria bacterium]|nr:spore coat protein U domain-containing protein [Pseudomonadota bacterium]MDA1298686.1 spore coat protein U domain-containing protein [Pseudomonadota bacterium]
MNKQLKARIKAQWIAAVLAAGTMMAAPVWAESNGSLGASSNGSVDVSISVPELVQLTFPGDIALTYSDGSDSVLTEEFCVYSNQASVDFDVTIDPSNTPSSGTAPVMKSGSNELAYQLDFKKADGTSISANIAHSGTTASNQGDANQVSKTCASGGNSHELTVTVLESAIEAATDGSYTDTVNVTVAAN